MGRAPRHGCGAHALAEITRGAARIVAGVVTWDYNVAMIANVRTAKARLSELLDRAAAGEEVVITSDGRPKARLVAVHAHPPFRVNRALLARQPRRRRDRGARARHSRRRPAAEDIVRADRDARD